MFKIDVMPDSSEIIHYNVPKLPIFINEQRLSQYPNMRALCHWHEDIEWIYIIEGEMKYDINGKNILLRQGDCLMVNSMQMHFGYAHKEQECLFICLVCHPLLLHFNTQVYNTYVTPIIKNRSVEYIHYPKSSPISQSLASYLQAMHHLNQQPATAYEFELIAQMYRLWQIMYQENHTYILSNETSLSTDVYLQKQMVAYIYQHYSENINLNDIANSGHVSKSKCCILFKKYLHQSPIDFLNAYRLEVACHLLNTTNSSITQIASSCGFNHLSYFSKLFMRKYNCSPRSYRENFL